MFFGCLLAARSLLGTPGGRAAEAEAALRGDDRRQAVLEVSLSGASVRGVPKVEVQLSGVGPQLVQLGTCGRTVHTDGGRLPTWPPNRASTGQKPPGSARHSKGQVATLLPAVITAP
eukprot:1194856-Prorocentrum_minimum.AAC.1